MFKKAALRKSVISIAVVCAVTGGGITASTAIATAAPTGTTASPVPGDYGSSGQGAVTPVHPDRPSLTASALAPKISRSETIRRAQGWVGKGIRYDWNGSYQGYRTDCSGYVSMAWNLDASLTTDTFGSRGVTERISKSELKPGDALLNSAALASGHVVLFEKWANSDKTAYVGYEFSTSGVHHREIPYPYFSGYGTFLPVRNKSVVDDAPVDPGMTELTAGDFNGDGRKDLVAVQVSTGKLFLYPNTGKSGLDMLGDRVEIGSGGWNGMKNLTVGDFNGDGKDDLVASKKEDGKLYLYPGTHKAGLGALDDRVEIGSGGWNGMKGLFAGDFDGDGKTDLGAVKTETGELFLYPGTQKNGLGALGDRVLIGTGGWNGMNKLVSPGDFNKDGKPDLIASKTETGELFLYPGTQKNGLAALGDRVLIGTGGWNGISDYAGADFTGDGIGDLAAVASDPRETGKLYLYKGNGTGLDSRTEIGTGGW
ncbi:FG-GAP-like repeat-containing protein [Streptomyces sp. NPDC003077]|uniref:C40 family peptidase n=1 Tax=Streptomyces sp. NPDC003077 TaxID=3154443 RepID=UPI0033A4983B